MYVPLYKSCFTPHSNEDDFYFIFYYFSSYKIPTRAGTCYIRITYTYIIDDGAQPRGNSRRENVATEVIHGIPNSGLMRMCAAGVQFGGCVS